MGDAVIIDEVADGENFGFFLVEGGTTNCNHFPGYCFGGIWNELLDGLNVDQFVEIEFHSSLLLKCFAKVVKKIFTSKKESAGIVEKKS